MVSLVGLPSDWVWSVCTTVLESNAVFENHLPRKAEPVNARDGLKAAPDYRVSLAKE